MKTPALIEIIRLFLLLPAESLLECSGNIFEVPSKNGGARLPSDLTIGPENQICIVPNTVARPKDAPSRGRALDHGSARFQVY